MATATVPARARATVEPGVGSGAERAAPAAPRFTERHLQATLLTVAAMVFTVAAGLRLRAAPAGDEPHYLAITVALLKYHTVDPSPVYAHPADYHPFYPGLLAAQASTLPGGTVVPLHNAGAPLLWAPFYLIGARAGVAVFLVLVSVLIVFNLYRMLRELRIDPAYAGIVTALFIVGSPVYVYAPMMFIESLGALVVLYAARQLLAPVRSPRRLLVASAGLGYLPLVHGRLAIFTVLIGALLAIRTAREVGQRGMRGYLCALGPLVAVAGATTVFTAVRYGTVNPAAGNANMGAGLLQVPFYQGLLGMLFDRYYGLLPYFPLFAFVVPGVVLSARRGTGWVHATLLGITVPYLLAVSTFGQWWGGYSPPARFPAAVAPLLAYYVAVTLRRLHSWSLSMLAMLAAVLSFMVSLAGDLSPADRFDAGAHGRAMLIDQVGRLFGAPRLTPMLPSVLRGGANGAKFALCVALLLAFSAAVVAAGRRRDPAWVPAPPAPPWQAIRWPRRRW